jgi:LuxR family maltose regulon positive regulatory protein
MPTARDRILSRVAISESRLISIVAPAGFGKTTVADMIAASLGTGIRCDVTGASDLVSFARCVVAALRRAAPQRETALSSDLFKHLQPGVTSAQLASFVLDAWSTIDDDIVVVFDNLEAIVDQPESLDLLVRLIKAADMRTVILCSRPPLPLVNSRLIPPNEHLRLGVEDLAFTRDEMREIMSGLIDEAQLDRIAEWTQGWPVAVLLLRQLGRLGKLERTLDRAGDAGVEQLRDYLVGEVLGTIQGPYFDALLALVAIPTNGQDSALRASGGTATPEIVNDLTKRLPLVRRGSDGHYLVHPMIVSLIETTAASTLERFRLRAAESYERDGMLSEAARQYLATGRIEEAAVCLERVVGSFLERNAFAGLDDLLERLPAGVIARYPRLWAMLALVRRSVVPLDVLVAEGYALRESLRGSLQTLEAKQVSAVLVKFLTHLGRHDEADEILREHPIEDGQRAPGDTALQIAAMIRDVLTGRTHDVLQRYRRLMPLVHNDLLRAYCILRV